MLLFHMHAVFFSRFPISRNY